MSKRAVRAAILAGVVLNVLPSMAQEKQPELIITPNRIPMSIQQIGSSVTVITQEEIEKQGNKSLRDILSGQPGLQTTETGGPGAFVSVFVRGAEARHTLILVDGVRFNDPTSTGNETDLSLIPVQSIERIEIVRGPQSALYGSDAMGGVINVITKKGTKRQPLWQMRVEGGSYGTYGTQMSVSGATTDTSYNVGVSQYHSDGFKRYAYRVDRLASLNPRGTDPTNRYGANLRISKQLNDWLTIESGVQGAWSKYQFDGAEGSDVAPFMANFQTNASFSAYQKVVAENGPFRTTLTTFETRIVKKVDRRGVYTDTYTDPLNPTPTPYQSFDAFRGSRIGAELQEDVDLKSIGKVTLGTRFENEKADSNKGQLGSQSTRSAFALYQVSPISKLNVSLGGRLDDVSTFGVFATYRATASYDITSATRLHASYGTGAKAPSLYQLYDSYYGNAGLKAERSDGYDMGVEQTFLDGDARAGITYFSNRYRQLIDWQLTGYSYGYPIGSYFNVSKATTSGVEWTGEYNLVPSFARLKLAYTYLRSRGEPADVTSIDYGQSLVRRPRDSARVSVAFTPARDWTIEPLMRFVGARSDKSFDVNGTASRVTLKAYTRFDISADYKLNKNVSLFMRAENLTNVKYEDVYNYGTPGRSAYAGLHVNW